MLRFSNGFHRHGVLIHSSVVAVHIYSHMHFSVWCVALCNSTLALLVILLLFLRTRAWVQDLTFCQLHTELDEVALRITTASQQPHQTFHMETTMPFCNVHITLAFCRKSYPINTSFHSPSGVCCCLRETISEQTDFAVQKQRVVCLLCSRRTNTDRNDVVASSMPSDFSPCLNQSSIT